MLAIRMEREGFIRNISKEGTNYLEYYSLIKENIKILHMNAKIIYENNTPNTSSVFTH